MVGVAVYALAIGVPLLFCAVYLHSIGPLRLPTSARQTIPAWVTAIYSFAFYFGGCMIACSSARWIGTRVLPLGTAFLVSLASLAIHLPAIIWLTWVWISLLCTFLALGVLGLLILARASQDTFENAPRRVSPSFDADRNWCRSLVLICGSILTSIAVLMLPSNFSGPSEVGRYVQTKIDESGELWFVLVERGEAIQRARIGADMDAMVVQSVPVGWTPEEQPANTNRTININRLEKFQPIDYWSVEEIATFSSEVFIYDPLGYVLVYAPLPSDDRYRHNTWLLSYVIGQDRISRAGETRGSPFLERPKAITAFSRKMVVTKDGVFRFDKETGEVVRVAALGVDGYAVENSGKSPRLFLNSDNKMFVYPNQASSEPAIALQPESTMDVGQDLIGILTFWYKDQDNFTALTWVDPTSYQVVKKSSGKGLERFRASIPKEMSGTYNGQSISEKVLECIAIPAAYFLIGGSIMLIVVTTFGETLPEFGPGLELAIFAIAIQVLLSCCVAFAAARHRGLSKKARMGWAIAGALLGFGIGLAILAIYPRCIRETCSRCQKLRRVELSVCEHCGNAWDLPNEEGIEIVDNKTTALNEILSIT